MTALIEALEKIAESGSCIRDIQQLFKCDSCGNGNKDVCPRYIAAQALASQECDITKCEFYYTNKVGGTIYQSCSYYIQTNDEGYSQDTLCSDNPNCLFKQCHSQEKTFTVEEIRKIIKKIGDDFDLYEGVDVALDYIIAEFEKEVGNENEN